MPESGPSISDDSFGTNKEFVSVAYHVVFISLKVYLIIFIISLIDLIRVLLFRMIYFCTLGSGRLHIGFLFLFFYPIFLPDDDFELSLSLSDILVLTDFSLFLLDISLL